MTKCKQCGFKCPDSASHDYNDENQAHIKWLHDNPFKTPQDFARLFLQKHKFKRKEAEAYLAGLYHGRLIVEVANFFKPESKSIWSVAEKCAKEAEKDGN